MKTLTADYELLLLVTVGDEMPGLVGEWGSFMAGQERFAMSGLPDGLGIFETPQAGHIVFMNHEISGRGVSRLSTQSAEVIKGARVSLLAFDSDWRVIGGKNLVEAIEADGELYMFVGSQAPADPNSLGQRISLYGPGALAGRPKFC